jgi:cytochrome c peroxidase
MGSNNILVYDAEGKPIEPDPVIAVEEGPVGLALDEPRKRLYALNRFSNSISIIDTERLVVVGTLKLFDPTPEAIRSGRKHFYNTHESSGLGQVSCASCHVDARFDRLAWDLGAPNGSMQMVSTNNRNFARFPPGERRDFHPMKGPMVTQTLQDIIGHEPFHWRGDKDGLEEFNGTFTNLQAAAAVLTTNEMQEFKGFLSSIHFPPNPYRSFSNGLPNQVNLSSFTVLGHRERTAGSAFTSGSPQNGLNLFRAPQVANGCNHCHTTPTGLGPHMNFVTNMNRWRDLPPGTNGARHVALIALRRSNLLPFKIPSLRNLHDKLGFTLQKTVSRSGFGFLHDGSVDSLPRLLQDSLNLATDQQTGDLMAFLLCFTGSDLPVGIPTDREHPPGVAARDAHAAVGKQVTLRAPARLPRLSSAYSLTRGATSRVDIIARGLHEGVPRGWVYDQRTLRFLSDRAGETWTDTDLERLATPENPITFTVLARGAGVRLGIDRDEDGYPDRTELDLDSDPSDPRSRPSLKLKARINGDRLEITWNSLPGKIYQVQVKAGLEDEIWRDASTRITAGGATATFTGSVRDAQRQFYRIVEVVQ